MQRNGMRISERDEEGQETGCPKRDAARTSAVPKPFTIIWGKTGD